MHVNNTLGKHCSALHGWHSYHQLCVCVCVSVWLQMCVKLCVGDEPSPLTGLNLEPYNLPDPGKSPIIATLLTSFPPCDRAGSRHFPISPQKLLARPSRRFTDKFMLFCGFIS